MRAKRPVIGNGSEVSPSLSVDDKSLISWDERALDGRKRTAEESARLV
jgi:hypothetical protein